MGWDGLGDGNGGKQREEEIEGFLGVWVNF